jgi:hypothetical protein
MPVPPASPPLPRWARVADLLCVLLVVLAAIVAVSGGFRVHPLGVRIALTSPERPLVLAALIGVARHLVVRQPPIYRDLSAALAAAWRTAPVREATTALVGTRLSVLFVGYMAVFLFGYANGQAPFRVSPNEFLNLQARWDTGWYLGIASSGYRYDARAGERQRNIVFFPALPLLMRVAGRAFGGSAPAFLLGGTVVVLLALAGAFVYLFRLARSMLGDEDQARYSVWLMAAYPFALFFSAVYTESLFLVGALGAFYHFRRGEFRYAAIWGLLVGLTRPNGCFLSIPLALLAVTPWLPRWLGGPDARERPPSDHSHLIPALAAAAMPGVGVLLYSAYIWSLTGDPLAWAAGHVAWGRSYQGLSVLVTERYEYLSGEGLYAYTSKLTTDLLQAIGPIFVLAATWGVARRLGPAYAAFILVNILPPLAAGGLLSAGRFSAVLFPAFIWFASVVPARHRSAWIVAFMAIQAFNAALFYTWRQMY